MKFLKKIKALVALLIILNLAHSNFYIPEANAQSVGGGSCVIGAGRLCSGGTITYEEYCVCSANWLIYFQDQSTNQQLQLIFQPGVSQTFDAYNIYGEAVEDGYLLGYYPGGGECEQEQGEDCDSEGNPQGIISYLPGIGTSEAPALDLNFRNYHLPII